MLRHRERIIAARRRPHLVATVPGVQLALIVAYVIGAVAGIPSPHWVVDSGGGDSSRYRRGVGGC